MRDTRAAKRTARSTWIAAVHRYAGRPVGFLVGQLLRLSGRKLGAAVMYHRIGHETGDYTRELVPSLGEALFETQVRQLASCFRLVRASELPEALASRRRGQRIPVALTFDDDLSSQVDVAAPVLKRNRVTATFFLTGACLDGPSSFWWEDLQAAVDRDAADKSVLAGVTPAWLADPERRAPEHIHDVALALQLMEPSRREPIAQRLAAATGNSGSERGLRAADVRQLASAGFEIGFHTRHHHYLPNLDDEQLRDAMHEGVNELEDAAGYPLRSIAYPYGGGDERVAAAAHDAGFRIGYTTIPNAITERSHPLLLERIEAPFTDAGQLASRVAWRLVVAAYGHGHARRGVGRVRRLFTRLLQRGS